MCLLDVVNVFWRFAALEPLEQTAGFVLGKECPPFQTASSFGLGLGFFGCFFLLLSVLFYLFFAGKA